MFKKFFNKETPTAAMLHRALVRSLVLIFLCVAAGAMLEFLIVYSRQYGMDITARFPELMIIFRAVSIMAWFEMSIFWIRLAMQPKTDHQESAKAALANPVAAAMVYVTHMAGWAFRVWVLMRLCDFV